jgi:hypothetical protein
MAIKLIRWEEKPISSSLLDTGRPIPLPQSFSQTYINHLLPKNISCALKKEAGFASETLVSIYKTTRYYCPEDQHDNHRKDYEHCAFLA